MSTPSRSTPGGSRPPRASAPYPPRAEAAAKAVLTPGRIWARSARFLTTASQLHQLPEPSLPEIAFVGRSNAGKSTAINTLAQHRRLAFASKTPGRTQHINLFELGPEGAPDQRWADLPGYGYAAVARGEKLRWQQVMADYLAQRHALAGVVMLVDSRHGLTALDQRLLDFIAFRVQRGEVRLMVLLTKADKLSRNEQAKSLAAAEDALAPLATEAADIGLVLFSATAGLGVDDVAEVLHGWREGAVAADIALAETPAPPPAPTSTAAEAATTREADPAG